MITSKALKFGDPKKLLAHSSQEHPVAVQVGGSEPREMASKVDYMFLMLGFPKDIEDMIYDPNTGIMNQLKENSYIIDHTTSSPGLAQKIAADLKKLKNIKKI